MSMNFTELTVETRKYMLDELEIELKSPSPYVSQALSSQGLAAFPNLLRKAIASGTEVTLFQELMNPLFWKTHDRRGSEINMRQAAERLALSEFNTWYVRGLSKKLLDEGETECEVYRADQPKHQAASCSSHEEKRYSLQEIRDGHRAHYWPKPGNRGVLSIPPNPSCHHTIRRVSYSTTLMQQPVEQ